MRRKSSGTSPGVASPNLVWGNPKPVLEYCEKSLENPALGIPGERDLLGGEMSIGLAPMADDPGDSLGGDLLCGAGNLSGTLWNPCSGSGPCPKFRGSPGNGTCGGGGGLNPAFIGGVASVGGR